MRTRVLTTTCENHEGDYLQRRHGVRLGNGQSTGIVNEIRDVGGGQRIVPDADFVHSACQVAIPLGPAGE